MTHQGTANLYSALPADTDDHSAVANMASGPSDQSDVLQDELTCPVCLDVFHDPHLLPCGHNFCKMCLDRLRRLTDQSRFQCPECRDSHRCNRSFQKNFKLANIALDFRRRRRAAAVDATAQPPKECVASTPTGQQDYVPCDYCPPPSGAGASADAGFSQERGDMQESAAPSGAAVKMCLKCEVSMCPEHVKPHLELPAFREHPLTEPMRDFWKRKCPDHDEIFRYYCLDDKVCVCNACTIEGRHLGHTIKTLKNTMKDIKQEVLNKQLHKTEKKYGMAKKKLHEQTEKERQNKKFLEDAEGCLARLRQDLEEKVSAFVSRLMQCTRTNCETIGPAIQKNISRICQDLARLREVRCGIKSLVQENDPFRFIEAYKTTGRQCRKQLKRSMFYPEYVDMDPGLLGIMMEEELQKFLDLDLTFYVFAAINFICQRSDIAEERGENEDVARQADDDDDNNDDNDDDDDDDNDDDSSEEEMSGDEEEEGEEEEENEGHELSESDDELYVPEEEEEAQEEEEEDDREEEDDDDEEDGEERD